MWMSSPIWVRVLKLSGLTFTQHLSTTPIRNVSLHLHQMVVICFIRSGPMLLKNVITSYRIDCIGTIFPTVTRSSKKIRFVRLVSWGGSLVLNVTSTSESKRLYLSKHRNTCAKFKGNMSINGYRIPPTRI